MVTKAEKAAAAAAEKVSSGAGGDSTAAQPADALAGTGDDGASSPSNSAPQSGDESGTAGSADPAGATPEAKADDGAAMSSSDQPAPADTAAAGPDPEQVRHDAISTMLAGVTAHVRLEAGGQSVEGSFGVHDGEGFEALAGQLYDKLHAAGATGALHSFDAGAARCSNCDLPRWMAATQPCKPKARDHGQADSESA